MTFEEAMTQLKGLSPEKAVARLNMMEYSGQLDPGHVEVMRRALANPQANKIGQNAGLALPTMSSAPIKVSSPNYVPPTPVRNEPPPEVIDLNELHKRALGRAEEVPGLLQQTGYGHQLIQQAQPPQMQTPAQHGGNASLNFLVPGDTQATMQPGQPTGAINSLRQFNATDEQNSPEMQTPARKSVTELAQMKDKNAQRGMYDPEGYYIGAQQEDPNKEINRLNHAMELEQPGAETLKDVQRSVDANQIKSPKPLKKIGMFDSDTNPDPWQGVHHMGDTGGSFLDEVEKTFKLNNSGGEELTSDPAAKTDIRSTIGKPQYAGSAKHEKHLYSPPGMKTNMTPPPGSQSWNAAQWDEYHKTMTPDENNAQFNQGYQQSHQTQTQQQIQEAQNSPQMRQWRDYNDTSGPAPGQSLQDWAQQRMRRNGGFGEEIQNSPMPQNAPGMNAGQPGHQWTPNGQGKVYIDQYGRERNAVQHSSDMSAMEGDTGNPYIPQRANGAIIQGQSGSAQSRIQAQQQGESYYRHQRYGNRGWDLGDMMHGATGGMIGDQMQGPAQGQSEGDWEAQQDQIARQNMYSDPKEKADMHEAPASHEVDGFLDSLGRSYATYKYKDPSKEPTEQPTGGRYMGVMAPSVAKSPTGDTIVKKDGEGLEYLDEKPSLSAALAALGRLHERLKLLEGKKR